MKLEAKLDIAEESAGDLLQAARTLGDVLDLTGAGFALLDPEGNSLVENRSAHGLPRSRAWLALVGRPDPVDFDHLALSEFFSSMSRELYALLANEARTPRIGHGPFHVGSVSARVPDLGYLTTLLFTSRDTLPVVRLLLSRLTA